MWNIRILWKKKETLEKEVLTLLCCCFRATDRDEFLRFASCIVSNRVCLDAVFVQNPFNFLSQLGEVEPIIDSRFQQREEAAKLMFDFLCDESESLLEHCCVFARRVAFVASF